MVSLAATLVSERGITESSAGQYIRCLTTMNGKQGFKTLAFLKKTDAIEPIIANYADNTRAGYYVAAVSALQLFKTKAGYKSVYDYYYKKMLEAKHDRRVADESNVKSDKQEKEWIAWEDVLKVHAALKTEVAAFATAKHLTKPQYGKLLDYVVLSLYVLMRPRRNADYHHMYVTPSITDGLVVITNDRNYYATDTHKMMFHVFKTAKTAPESEKSLEVPADMQEVLALLIRHHPLAKGKRHQFKLLVNYDGSPITAGNAITRQLNRIFKKHVSSSMLRHSYLSGKYGKVLEEMKDDSAAMAHGLTTQRNYIKMDGEASE